MSLLPSIAEASAISFYRSLCLQHSCTLSHLNHDGFVKRCYVCRISDLAIHEHSHRNINPMKILAFAQKTLPIDAQLFKIDEDRLEGIVAVLPCYRSDSLTRRYQVVVPLHARRIQCLHQILLIPLPVNPSQIIHHPLYASTTTSPHLALHFSPMHQHPHHQPLPPTLSPPSASPKHTAPPSSA